MSFLQKIGLVKEDELIKPPAPPVQQPVVQTTYQTFGQVNPPTVSSKTDYNKHLDDVLDKNNQPGFDFLEFNKMLIGLDTKPLVESQKYETAFSAAQSMGVTATDLVSSGQRYLTVLATEETDFNSEMQNATATKVDAKKTEIDRLTQRNTELSQEIEANNKKSQELNMALLESDNSLRGEKQAFEYALNNKRVLINDRLAKIQQYLNGISK